MRVAILCNGKDLALWQRRAVETIAPDHELSVLACCEPPAQRRFGHWAYYALNLLTVRNRQTRRVPFPDVPVSDRLEVRPTMDGNWAQLPDDALGWLRAQQIDVIVKFGLGLLRVPEPTVLPIPILSYHHGDPRAYRGRPAGFWELAQGEPLVGQVVQILSNSLDAGQVVAFAESRTVAHSYRQTLIEAYSLSPHLLAAALRHAAAGSTLAIAPTGRNYRLPGNWTVVKFVLARWAALLRWLAYGAFVEKQWAVAAVADIDASDPISAVRAAEARLWTIPPLIRPYRFYADPFFDPESGDILMEALNGWSGKGELVRLRAGGIQPLRRLDGHVSYPGGISEGGKHFLVPEISEWSRPGIFSIEGTELRKVADLDIADDRLIDPTLFRQGDTLYLFANTEADGPNVLHLWTAPSLFARFERHRLSPVRVSVRGSRMAGHIMPWQDSLYRIGQDSRKSYGDGLLAFKIRDLSPTAYGEEPAGEVAFSNAHGPHTLNRRGTELLFDFYRERFSLLAGIRRIVGKI